MKKILAVMLFPFILILSGCGESANKEPIEPVLNVEQFSLVNQAFVNGKLGEPKSVETWNYQTPSTGANNALTTLEYDWDGYYSEFHFDDKDRLVQINIYASDNKDSKFVKTTFDDHLKQLGITPGERLTKVKDTGYAWRYQSVTDNIDEVWSMGDEKGFDAIKISFDVRPFM